MLFNRIALCTALAASALLLAGCQDDAAVDNTEPLPSAYDDPSGNTALSGGGAWDASSAPGAWGDGATDSAIGAANGEWSPVDPGNNLGFPVVYFGYDADALMANESSKLDKVAGYMEQQPELGLIVEGHCDQRGTEEYNRALGERRANAIRSYLNGRGIADSRIKTISFGEDKPAVDGSGESVWSQNRRGVLIPARMK